MSNNILTPTIASIDDHSSTSATIVIEPMYSGYGMTLGNSLRRVLLSSISGSAITAFKIEGVTHEFTTVEGVKEDVIDIMMNLKLIRFKVFAGETHTLRLVKKGKGVVTASDIQANADVEIVNKDAFICNYDGSKDLIMDIRVEVGRGYRVVEEMGNQKPSDMIAVDALFSPVLRVRYNVTDTRIGQMTNLDKLFITINTDGTITPREAFEEASAILVTQYSALAGKTRIESTTTGWNKPAGASLDVDDGSELLTPIEDLNLSQRTTNALINNEIHNLKDLFTLSDAELRELKGFGSKALDEVKQKLAELEL